MVLIYGHEGEFEVQIYVEVADVLNYCKVTSPEDPFVALAKDGVKEISLALRQGTYLVDILPWRTAF